MSTSILSIIVPVHNEETTVVPLMQRLSRACLEAQIIYIDDGSQDASPALLQHHARPQDIVLTKENGGKGSAIREGLQHVQGTYVIIQDADLEYDPEEIPLLLREAQAHNLSALLGSRRLKKQKRQYSRLRYFVGGNLLSSICNVLFRTHITDLMTCYKLIRTDLLQSLPLRCSGFDLDAEIVACIARRKIPIEERAITYHPRSQKEGKKINWKDFCRCLWMLLRIRCSRERPSHPPLH